MNNDPRAQEIDFKVKLLWYSHTEAYKIEELDCKNKGKNSLLLNSNILIYLQFMVIGNSDNLIVIIMI